MGYKKKYKEALERAREFQKSKDGLCVLTAESIFPELQESEDERIRKTLLESFEYQIKESYPDKEWICGVKLKEIVAWLEKQGEQKATDKVEPKFHEGNWITCKELNTARIIKVDDDRYEVEFIDGSKGFPHIDYIDRNFHLWTLQDAKDGDVLYSPCRKLLWIYKDEKTCRVGSNLNYNSGSVVINKPICIPTDVHPATKEQRDTLSAKMKEAGYEWDAEKKELKLLISNGGDFESPTWSDEDETGLTNTIIMLKEGASHHFIKHDITKVVNWLKSLKERLS